MKLALTLACGEYDRTYPLRDGSVVPEGIDLNYVSIPPADLFRRQARETIRSTSGWLYRMTL